MSAPERHAQKRRCRRRCLLPGVREIAPNAASARLAFSRKALSTAARRTSSTPSPCLLTLRKNAAPLRRVSCRDFPGSGTPKRFPSVPSHRLLDFLDVIAKPVVVGGEAGGFAGCLEGLPPAAGVEKAEGEQVVGEIAPRVGLADIGARPFAN